MELVHTIEKIYKKNSWKIGKTFSYNLIGLLIFAELLAFHFPKIFLKFSNKFLIGKENLYYH